jgi:hypothetical protein
MHNNSENNFILELINEIEKNNKIKKKRFNKY